MKTKRDKRVTKKVEKAFHMALARYAQRPEVTGIDIGFRRRRNKVTGTIAIRIHVREKMTKAKLGSWEIFPRMINGVPVDIIQGVYEDACAFDPNRAQARDPIQPGISIGPAGGPTGTLGAFVTDNTNGGDCILSCFHVLMGGPSPKPDDPVLQQSPEDGGRAANSMALLERFNRETDSAIANVSTDRAVDQTQFGTNIIVSGTRVPSLGETLEKSGRSSGVTQALVEARGNYGNLKHAIALTPLYPGDPDQEVSAPGDSGALWYDPATGVGVGLHCKGEASGSNIQEVAIATELVWVEHLLNITV